MQDVILHIVGSCLLPLQNEVAQRPRSASEVPPSLQPAAACRVAAEIEAFQKMSIDAMQAAP